MGWRMVNQHAKIMTTGTILIRIWRKIKSNPKRTWLGKEFSVGYTKGVTTHTKRALHILEKMDLIEIVPAIYRCKTGGTSKNKKKKWTVSHTVKGYRMKKQEVD